jgi:hypothetical protein
MEKTMTDTPRAGAELLACPFCGDTRQMTLTGGPGRGVYVSCMNCWSSGPAIEDGQEAEYLSRAAWNRRAAAILAQTTGEK